MLSLCRYPFPSLEIKMYVSCANKILVKPLDELCKDSNIVAKGKSDAVMQLYEILYFHRSQYLHVIICE